MPLPGPARPAESARAASELAKALLIDTETGTAHPVMYNPEELKLDQGNVVAEIGIPGLDRPPVQYVRGNARVLSMELFFDTYETGEDVRAHTTPIVRLLDRLPHTKAPPVLLFSLGRMQFRCVLVEASQRFTMFLRDGTPVRCTMSVRLQEYAEAEVEIRRGLFFGSPTVSAAVDTAVAGVTRAGGGPGRAAPWSPVHRTVLGDTLSGIAAAYLGDPARWREIAEANDIDDPFDLRPGLALTIPEAGPGAGGAR